MEGVTIFGFWDQKHNIIEDIKVKKHAPIICQFEGENFWLGRVGGGRAYFLVWGLRAIFLFLVVYKIVCLLGDVIIQTEFNKRPRN